MPVSSANRNLLFGILAVQLDFVTKDALIRAMNDWLLDKNKPLDAILRDRGDIRADELKHLAALVDFHLKRHGNDPAQSLAALSSVASDLRKELAAVPDEAVQQSLLHVKDESNSIRTIAAPPRTGNQPLRYRILRPHAKVGLGEVFIAEDTELGRSVALKEIQARFADDAMSRSRFVLEAEVTGGLEHPGIVPVYGLGTYADGRPFYAMRFIKGDNLQDAIARFHNNSPCFDSLEFRKLLQRFIDVCNAIAYAHSRGVLHRDLKPGNIMLGNYGETMVVDWGLARLAGDRGGVPTENTDEAFLQPRSGGESSATVQGELLGTPAYMPPEQAEGRWDLLGVSSDVYSLGATLYELLTGRAPFHGSREEILASVRRGEFQLPRQIRAAVPRALEAVCLKALALNQANRFESAQELAKEIERWLADEAVRAWKEPINVRARRFLKRHRTAATAAAALVFTTAIAAAIGIIVVSRERDQKDRALQTAVAARRQTREALNTLTDDAVQRLFSRKAQIGAEERAFLKRVQQQYERLGETAGNSLDDRVSRADGYFRIGCIGDTLGEFAAAETAFRTAIKFQEQLVSEFPANSDYRWNLVLSHHNLGALLYQITKIEPAEAAWREALSLLNQLTSQDSRPPEYRAKIADVQNDLGMICRDTNRSEQAEANYRGALKTLTGLVADDPSNTDYRNSLGASRNNLADFLTFAKRPLEAENEFRSTRDIFAELVAQKPTPEFRHRLATAHNNLGAQLLVNHKPAEAEVEHRAALRLADQLASEFPAVAEYRIGLADCFNNLGLVLVDAGRLQDAGSVYSEALTLRIRLAAAFVGSAEHESNLATTLVNVAELDRRLGHPDKALARLTEALPHWKAVLKVMPDSASYRFGYREHLRETALALADNGDFATIVAKAEEILSLAYDPLLDAQIAAQALAYAGLKVAADKRLPQEERSKKADECASRAVALLRRSIEHGNRDFAQLLQEPDLAGILGRDDFAALLWEWADAPSESKPPAQ
jgi:serine/threonine-protein kinase